MLKVCYCENGNVNLAKEGIFFLVSKKELFCELECANCGETISINEYILSRFKYFKFIDIRSFSVDKKYYTEELKYIVNILEEMGVKKLNYNMVADILGYIINMYNKEYYELFYMYKFETVRKITVELVYNKYIENSIGFTSYEKFKDCLIKELKTYENDFDILKFLKNNIFEDVFSFGPCIFYQEESKKTGININERILEKTKYDENSIKIKLDILSSQLENSEKIEKYLKKCYNSGFLSNKVLNPIYEYKNKNGVNFYEAFIYFFTTDTQTEILHTDLIIVHGMLTVLKEVFEVGYIKVEDVTFENYHRLLENVNKIKQILDTYL